MRKFTSLACLSLVSLLSACGTPNDGYYDKNGNFIPNNPQRKGAANHAPLPGGTYDERYTGDPAVSRTTVTTTTRYDRPGYYDEYGYYRTMEGGWKVPADMFPPRGMCRVWFRDRPLADQPPVESCSGINDYVPSGAYVIYGG